MTADAAIYLILVVSAVACAYCAMTSTRILTSTIHLACLSALVAIALYLMGAYHVAVIELSVGAGLVTVLLVYAISVIGDDAADRGSVIPKPVAVGLTLLAALMLGCMAMSLPNTEAVAWVGPLLGALWQQRVLDVWIQMILIFAGVLGILGLLAEGKSATADASRHGGNGHKTVRVVPPTACEVVGSQARSVEDLRTAREEVHV